MWAWHVQALASLPKMVKEEKGAVFEVSLGYQRDPVSEYKQSQQNPNTQNPKNTQKGERTWGVGARPILTLVICTASGAVSADLAREPSPREGRGLPPGREYSR